MGRGGAGRIGDARRRRVRQQQQFGPDHWFNEQLDLVSSGVIWRG